MKIVHIIPGSGGGFYCGNCLRDSKLLQYIQKHNTDAIVLPMYLPLFSHENKQEVPVFYGAVSIYLKQIFPFLRKAPIFFDKLLNSKPILKFAAKMANSTRATGLEEMTISMLMGEEGKQNNELEKMVSWLENNYKADIIHISNALLLGMAPILKKRLNATIFCSLQDEDVWVDVMSSNNREIVWNLIKEKSAYVDHFISVSKYYAKFMEQKLDLPNDKISTIYLGVDPDDYIFKVAGDKPQNIGFLSRLCKENGLDILIDAFILLRSEQENNNYKLYLTGGSTADDKKFLNEQKRKIKKAGLTDSVIFIDSFDAESRKKFFSEIAILSVPVRNGEAFGIYLAEAMSSGVPVVQPALGAFPEIVSLSNGGVIYDENTPEKLAESIKMLFNDKKKLSKLSVIGKLCTDKHFNIQTIAKKMIDIYTYIKNKNAKNY